MLTLSQSDLDRFFSKLDPPNERGCREWNRATYPAGYGEFSLGSDVVLAHRVAFFIANGYWPEICRHTCDNPPCCEPAHLLDGSQADNVHDMIERDRHSIFLRTHCIHGHEYNEVNTRITRKGQRVCRPCDRDRRKKPPKKPVEAAAS